MGRPSLRQAVQGFQQSREPKRAVWAGWMINYEGRDDNSAKVTDEDGKVYVVLDQGAGTASGEVIKAWSDFRPVPGWPVLVGTRRDKPNEYSVLDIDGYAMGGQIDGMAKLGWHSEMHEWGHPTGSDDVVYSRWLQLYDFGVWPGPTGGLDVQDGVFNPSGTKIGFELSNVDFSLFTPSGSGSRWVLVCLTPTGTIELWPGTIVYGRFLTFADIPAAPVDNWWELAAVRLNYDTTTVVMRPDNENIVDLRLARVGWPQLKAGGTTGSGGSCDIVLTADLDNNLLELTEPAGVYTFDLDSQPSGTVFAAPTGSDGKPSFRFLTDSDVPDIHAHYPGTVELTDLARGGATTGQALVWSDGWTPAQLPAWENVIVVAKSGGDYTTIQAAVNAASAGDAILLMPGTYSESLTINKGISIAGLDRITCVIDGLVTVTHTSGEVNFSNLSMTEVGTAIVVLNTNYTTRFWYCTLGLTSTTGVSRVIQQSAYGVIYLTGCELSCIVTGAFNAYCIDGGTNVIDHCIIGSISSAANAYALYTSSESYARYSYCTVSSNGTDYSFYGNGCTIYVYRCLYNENTNNVTLADGTETNASVVTTVLPSDWDAGSVDITAENFRVDTATSDFIKQTAGATHGIFERCIDRGIQATYDHFTSGSIPTSHSWINDGTFSGAPSILNYSYSGTYLYAGGDTNRHFLAMSISTWQSGWYQIRAKPTHVSHVGIRVDDGSDNNYFEVGLHTTTYGIMTVRTRYRTGGGAINNTDRTTDLITAHMQVWRLYCYSALWPTSWTPYGYWIDEVPTTNVIGIGAAVTWVPARVGIVVDGSLGGAGAVSVDWLDRWIFA